MQRSVALATPASRLADYVELAKPRITLMVVLTTAAGYYLGADGTFDLVVLVHALLGTGVIASAASALNQVLERDSDARMMRTRSRPLPAGRMDVPAALGFGLVLTILGTLYLAVAVNVLTAAIGAATLLLYVLVYTPLKRRSSLCTIVGAVPGALPPVIGWCAAQGFAGADGALALFLVLFVWQLPHFFAIAWMYRHDYAGAGLKMLPGCDPTGRHTAAAMVLTAAALIPVGFLAVAAGVAGWLYVSGATLLWLLFVREAVRFARARSDGNAKRVLRGSLVYLPGVFALLLIDALVAL